MKKALWLIFFFVIFFLLPEFSVDATRGSKITVINDLSHESGKLGPYRALIIGINDYKDPKVPDLKTAVNDATSMGKLLRGHYGFQVRSLLDREATKEAIYRALRDLALSSKSDESVLIYYAGHGDFDRTYHDGWWIPADARGGDPVTYLDNILIQKAMRSMKARHVLLISDSCYSGTLFGQARAIPRVIDNKYYLNLYNEKSRWGMTSGNKTPVSDVGSGGHSVFAYQLIKELRQNKKPYFTTQELYTRIAPIVGNNSEQTPLCRPIRNTGDQGGEFVFVLSNNNIDHTKEARLKAEKRRLEQERLKLERIKMEIERQKIETEIKQIDEKRRSLEAKIKREEKIKQVGAKGEQFAYIPKPASSSNNAILDNKLNSKEKCRLAVFPFCEVGLSASSEKDQQQFMNFISKYTNDIPNIVLTHSFYPYDKDYQKHQIKSIRKLIDKNIEKKIWYISPRSSRKEPDFEILKELSKKINTDLILTFKMDSEISTAAYNNVTYRGFLFDIENNRYFKEVYSDEDSIYTKFGIVEVMTKKLFNSYLKGNHQISIKY